MNILVTYALPSECGNLRMQGHSLRLCQTGVGKVAAALATYKACMEQMPDLVLAIGSAGAIHHEVGTILLCDKFLDRDLEHIAELGVPFYHDFTEELKAWKTSMPVHSCVSSGDTFQTTIPLKGIAADVYDMEAFGAAEACKQLQLPFIAIKYVTDVIGQNSISHWEENVRHAKTGLENFLASFEIELQPTC